MEDKQEELLNTLIRGVNAQVIEEGDRAYIRDPVFHIIRNRVHAEFGKTLIRVNQYPYALKFINTLLDSQNSDGSWNEIHPNYNKPSALITSIVGETLLLALARAPDTETIYESVNRAKKYVLSCEMEPGYFLKSRKYTADYLNVDATCGAFLAEYGSYYSDTSAQAAAKRAADRIISFQREGWYPYTTNKGNCSSTLEVPCIHYQGVTMYYLLKIEAILHESSVSTSLLSATEWLASVMEKDGTFNWSRSGLMFAYHLSGAYAFGYAVLSEMAKIDPKFKQNAEDMLRHLNPTPNGLLPRWEKDSWKRIFHSIGTAGKVAKIGNFPFRERCFRFCYGTYREMARRRYSERINRTSFNLTSSVLMIKSSTVDPFTNYPDMFMTTEALDCISSVNFNINL